MHLNEQGNVSGTINGTIYIHLKISEHHVSAEVSIYPHGGSLTAAGSAGYHVNGGFAPFSGTIAVSRGTGTYAHARSEAAALHRLDPTLERLRHGPALRTPELLSAARLCDPQIAKPHAGSRRPARGRPADLALAAAGAAAAGAETATLHATFTPNRLGASTTIGFSFKLAGSGGGLPAPLSAISLRLPTRHRLSLDDARPRDLPAGRPAARGPAGCPPNSRLGSGSALVEVPFGAGAGKEIPEIQAVMGPPANENIVVLFYANGLAPVLAQIVMQAELIAGSDTIPGRLETQVPLIASVPAGPPVSILSVNATIGPAGLTYYETRHGHRVAFHPRGVSVPTHCPRGGFRFSARFTFTDATSASAAYSVPCPPHHR